MKLNVTSIVLLILAITLFGSSGSFAQSQQVPETRQQITFSYAPLVKQVAPAVVNIYASKVIQQRVVSPLLDDPFFRQFFEGSMPPGFNRQRLQDSLGSGVIVRSDGLIVTSNHVIQGADQVKVVLSDRREFDAKVITSDDHSDLAVLRVEIKGEHLPYIELRDSDEAQVGDLVLAIGDPFGVGQTVTSGIISALARTGVGTHDLNYFIQTDAAINPGNSGGALVTMDGKLIGINSSIYSQSGGNIGIGFAVPSNMVRALINAVAQGIKTVVRPWTGVGGQEVTPALASSLSMSQPSGMLVNDLHSLSPARKAGLRIGDVVTSVNNRTVDGPDAFQYRIATLPIGSMADLGIMRQGQKSDIQINLIAPPEDPPREQTIVGGRNPLTGATIANLSPALGEEMNIHSIERGAVVISLKDNTLAVSIGLQIGDVITAVNDEKVDSVSTALAAVNASTKGWRVQIKRGDNTLTIMVSG